jgi:hypothetical protein
MKCLLLAALFVVYVIHLVEPRARPFDHDHLEARRLIDFISRSLRGIYK